MFASCGNSVSIQLRRNKRKSKKKCAGCGLSLRARFYSFCVISSKERAELRSFKVRGLARHTTSSRRSTPSAHSAHLSRAFPLTRLDSTSHPLQHSVQHHSSTTSSPTHLSSLFAAEHDDDGGLSSTQHVALNTEGPPARLAIALRRRLRGHRVLRQGRLRERLQGAPRRRRAALRHQAGTRATCCIEPHPHSHFQTVVFELPTVEEIMFLSVGTTTLIPWFSALWHRN